MTPDRRRPARPSLGTELALAHVERFAASASTARQIRIMLDTPDLPRGSEAAVARVARRFDAKLVDRILAAADAAPVLAANPALGGALLLRLVLWAINRTDHRGKLPPLGAPGISTLGEPNRANADYDQACYATLRVLAVKGRLARYPFALRALLRRIVGPIFHPVMTVITDVAFAVRTLMACAELPLDVLLALDERLAHIHPNQQEARVELVRHPSARVELWRAMLRRGASEGVAKAIRATPAALEDAEVRFRLEELG